ncbi:MAG: baseplate J/gp47 family protein, partial [Candidatus Ornithomonoglobus sp.]
MARFNDITDVDFMGDITLDGLKTDAINYYTEALQEITGSSSATVPDERKAELYAAAQLLYQLMQTANDRARQNLLKYARGEYLDNLVLSRSMTRKTAESAVCTVRFTLSAARSYAIAIPAQTRVTTPARSIYFATDTATEIPAGEVYADIVCTATEGGSAANGLTPGEINTLVDPIAYVASVSNIDVTQGGADTETDDALAERFYNARNEYSTAGSENAYIYYTKAYSSTISDAVVKNNSAAVIDIYVLLESREAATEGFLSDLKSYLSN